MTTFTRDDADCSEVLLCLRNLCVELQIFLSLDSHSQFKREFASSANVMETIIDRNPVTLRGRLLSKSIIKCILFSLYEVVRCKIYFGNILINERGSAVRIFAEAEAPYFPCEGGGRTSEVAGPHFPKPTKGTLPILPCTLSHTYIKKY